MQELPAFPDLPDHSMTIALAGETFRYDRKFRPRLGAWYVDIRDADGEAIVLGRRLTTEAMLLASLPVEFPGVIYVRGPDRYRREELGDRVREVFLTLDELEPFEDDGDGFIVDFIMEEE